MYACLWQVMPVKRDEVSTVWTVWGFHRWGPQYRPQYLVILMIEAPKPISNGFKPHLPLATLLALCGEFDLQYNCGNPHGPTHRWSPAARPGIRARNTNNQNRSTQLRTGGCVCLTREQMAERKDDGVYTLDLR